MIMNLEQRIWDMEVEGGLSLYDRGRLMAGLQAAKLAKPYVEASLDGADDAPAKAALEKINTAITE